MNISRNSLDVLRGVPFFKMTGSGNDFVFFDGRVVPRVLVESPEVIRAICNRRNGIGADGVVVLEPGGVTDQLMAGPPAAAALNARIHYFNSDGTLADLCGNATLCSTTMAVHLALAEASGMGLSTPSGDVRSRIVSGVPEIDLPAVTDVRLAMDIYQAGGERRVGYAMVGVPHLVILCDDAEAVDVAARGPGLRRHPSTGAAGANVNWVSPRPDGTWRYRTFERGVEDETLACGTGAVATAILLAEWGLSGRSTSIVSSSGRTLTVTADRGANGWHPRLAGEGRVVFSGRLGEATQR